MKDIYHAKAHLFLQLQGVSKKTLFCDSFTDKIFAIFLRI